MPSIAASLNKMMTVSLSWLGNSLYSPRGTRGGGQGKEDLGLFTGAAAPAA